MEAMTPEPKTAVLPPADVVRAAFAAYNRGALDEGFAYLSPDVEWEIPEQSLNAGVHRGHAQFMRLLESEFEAFSEIHRDPVELEERGCRVTGIIAARMRGRLSGIELELRAPWVFTVCAGQIVRARPAT
ncbi:MAG TPA: nuclear transport factor 2 family protein [Thermoleophilaceae bacterium]|jgi:ketosteroid isomerase-like protein